MWGLRTPEIYNTFGTKSLFSVQCFCDLYHRSYKNISFILCKYGFFSLVIITQYLILIVENEFMILIVRKQRNKFN